MKKYTIYFSFGLLAALTSCGLITPDAPESRDVLAEPIEDLTPEQMNLHIAGDEEFAHFFSQDEGLGPIFVSNSCESCHVGDGKGHPLTTLTRFGKWNGSSFDNFDSLGGPQLQERSIAGYPGELIPTGATDVAKFLPPAVTGLGFIEMLHDTAIINERDKQAGIADGITGELSLLDPPGYFTPDYFHVNQGGKYIGRFGRKSGAINLLNQIVNAYKQDMGITSDFDTEDLYNVDADPGLGDLAGDPEVSAATVNAVVFYVKTLKAPTRRNESNAEVLAGEATFATIGCETCHRATWKTGPSSVSALNNAEFHPYTDFLLHDMGSGLNDGYTEGSAQPEEWRTTPLWGLGLSADSQGGSMFLMHDGRASTLNEAIQMHGGEATNSLNAYNALSTADKNNLIKFLESL